MVVTFYETWWEKDHLRIAPEVLKGILMDDLLLIVHDPATDKELEFTPNELRNTVEFDAENKEYVIPICSYN